MDITMETDGEVFVYLFVAYCVGVWVGVMLSTWTDKK